MSSPPICFSSWACWLVEMTFCPSLVTHTCCVLRQSDRVLARAGDAASQATASTPAIRVKSRRTWSTYPQGTSGGARLVPGFLEHRPAVDRVAHGPQVLAGLGHGGGEVRGGQAGGVIL